MHSVPAHISELLGQAHAAHKAGDAARLGDLLRQAAGSLTSFPHFMGVSPVQAIEVEPPGGVGPERGCVVVCPDGQLYAYELRYEEGQGLFATDPDLREALTPPSPSRPRRPWTTPCPPSGLSPRCCRKRARRDYPRFAPVSFSKGRLRLAGSASA